MNNLQRFSRIVILLLLVLAACGGETEEDDALPTLAPTAVSVPTEPNDDAIAAAEPTAVPTAIPRPVINPEDIDWPPQLIYSSPQLGEEVRLDGAITLRFDQPMDQASVEAAFAIEPAVDGEFVWSRPDTVIFTPNTKLARQQSYKVQVNETAVSQNGLALAQAIALNLQTVGNLEVSQLIPTADSRGIETDSDITIIFNRPVVPLTSTSNQASLPQPLTIDPATAGRGEWLSTSIYRFIPDEPLAGATNYTITVDPALEDIVGATLAASPSWQFTTESPTILNIAQDFERPFPLTQPITVTFNMPMNRASTENAITLSSGGNSTSLTYNWVEGDEIVGFTPAAPLQLDSDYELIIGTGASSASGLANLTNPETIRFRTVPLPAVIHTFPNSSEPVERFQFGFQVDFNAPMDWTTLEDRLQIDPAPKTDPDYFYDDFSYRLNVSFPLQGNTDYTITIPADAADPYGNTLGQPYTWSFRSADLPSVVSLNLPSQISQISTSFPSDVELIHRNLNSADILLYDVGLPLNLINEPYLVNDYRPATEPIGRFSIAPTLERGQVGLETVQLANGGTLPTGIYLVTVSSPDTADDNRFWQNQRNVLIVADTNIVVKEMFDTVHVWVTDIASGQPASGRNLTLYSQRGATLATAVSDSNGFASFPYQPTEPYLEGVTVVSNTPGQSGFGVARSQWTGNVNLWELGIQSNSSPETPVFAYIYTDRPIYRPGDTVYFKGIVREPNYGRYQLPQQTTLTLNLNTAFYDPEGGLQETLTVTVDPNGSFSGEYQLADGLTLGSYQFWLDSSDFTAYRSFTVAEYRAPEFQVELIPETAELLRGETTDVDLVATFFFGGSASDLAINWTVYEQSFAPNVPGSFYAFGDFGDFFYEDQGFFFGGGGGPFGNYVSNGNGTTDANGRFTITLPADLLAEADAGSRRVTVEATLQDEANLPVSATTEIIFHAADGYVGVTPADYVTLAGTTGSVNLITTDWAGNTLPNQDVEVVFYRREWQRSRSSEFGIYRTVWEVEDTEVSRSSVTTDDTGKATADFVPESGGTYLAVATLTDSGGRQMVSSTTIWSIDPAYVGWRTDPTQRSMPLIPDQDDYRPGDTARLLVQSPFTEPTAAWLTIERGSLIEQRVIELAGSTDLLEIPITADFAPNVHVMVTAVKPVTADENPYADIRVGVAELVVSPEQLALNIELTPQQDRFVPGETAVYDVRITDHSGQPVRAELSLALVDLAVLSLLEDNAPPILEAFYQKQPLRSQLGGTLFISGEGLEPEIPLEGGGFGGGGGDEAARSSLALEESEEDDPARSNFPDTAYWEAKVVTDDSGAATVEIPLPDTLTTWRLSSKAVTADSLVGQASVDVVVSLPLLIRPLTPRFLTVGDVVQLGAILNNNTGEPLQTAVSLEATGVTLNDDAEKTVTVPANGRSVVRWEVVVTDTTFADLTFRAVSGDLRDATKPSFGQGPNQLIPIYRYTGDDVVGTSGVLETAGRQVEAVLLPETADLDQGTVDITLSPSLAIALVDALEATNELDYEPECAHAIAYQLQPNVATAVAIRELDLNKPELAAQLDERIPAAIDQLETLAFPSGGWGWCYSQELDPYLTANVLLTLVKAEQAGYRVPRQAMSDASGRLRQLLSADGAAELANSGEVSQWVFYLYVLAETGDFLPDVRAALFAEQRGLMAPSTTALLALTYDLMGDSGADQTTLLANLAANGVVSATGVHWEDDSPDAWRHLASDIRETAVVIDVLSQLDPDNELLPAAVRWLMSNRTLAYWSTPLETAWGIQALGNWLFASGELGADYDYQLNVNLEEVTNGRFNAATANRTISTPLSQLNPSDVNFFDVQRGEGEGRLYYTLHLNAALDASQIGAVSRGLTIERTYYAADCDLETEDCQPITEIKAGEQVRVVLDITAPNNLSYLFIEDPLPAGAEGIDPGLATSQSDLGPETIQPSYRFGYWGYWYFNRVQFRDEKVVFMAGFLPAGSYQYSYVMQTTLPGSYQVRPTFGYQEFFPEVNGRSAGSLFTVNE